MSPVTWDSLMDLSMVSFHSLWVAFHPQLEVASLEGSDRPYPPASMASH